MKTFLWIIFCICFAYMVAKFYPVEYVSFFDNIITKVEVKAMEKGWID